MKKKWTRMILICLLAGILSACGKTEVTEKHTEKLKIVTSIFPVYDWTVQILGERVEEIEVQLLLKDGSDMHSYQPTVADIANISSADVFLYVGGESDFWVKQALANVRNSNLLALNLLEFLEGDLKTEEFVEGMQGAHVHEGEDEICEEEHEHHEHEEEHSEYDEHIWLSLNYASRTCEKIVEILTEIDAEHKEIYSKNLELYQEKLAVLDAKYRESVEGAGCNTLIFGDRFPFRYLVDEYDLEYYAAFPGCSAETEASFEVIRFLAEKAEELQVPAVLYIDGSDGKIAKTIARNTKSQKQEALQLNSLQSVSEKDIKAGKTYLSLMEENLQVLEEALRAEGEK